MNPLPRLRPLLALLALVWASSGPVAAADPKPTLAELLKEYEALGLPLPPKTAKLVRYEADRGFILNGKLQPPRDGLAFEIKPGTETEGAVLLCGTLEFQPSWQPRTREVKPEPAAAKDILLPEDALALALQCQARGWNELAQSLFERSQQENWVWERPAGQTPQKQLVALAWEYWSGHASHPTADRAPVAKRLKELLARYADLDTAPNRALLKSLELALVPSKSKPGSVEALIDALVDYHTVYGTFDALAPLMPVDAYWRIAELGFDAVPALIEHLGDERLTRARTSGRGERPVWRLRVGDLAGDLLEDLAAEELLRENDKGETDRNWLLRQYGWRVKKSAATQWWAKAQKIGEETYLLDRVLPAPKAARDNPNLHLLRVIAVKYPKRVPELYRTVLDKRPNLESWELVETLVACQLPAKDKLDLVLMGAKHGDYNRRLPALRALKDLDKKQFDSLLIETIESFPTDVRGEYWTCEEHFIAKLAIESGDPRVWTVLEKVAKRAKVGLRMELLSHLSDRRNPKWRVERLRLLAAFLDDAEVRDRKADKRFEGPCAEFNYERIEVRDFVAIELAWLLGGKIELKLNRTAEEWAKERDKVRAALKRELEKKE
jgi:hypothetical protein